MSKLKAVSLFCGCGGTDVGLKGDFEFLGQHYSSNGVDIVFANDIEPKAIDILEKNFSIEPSIKNTFLLRKPELKNLKSIGKTKIFINPINWAYTS